MLSLSKHLILKVARFYKVASMEKRNIQHIIIIAMALVIFPTVKSHPETDSCSYSSATYHNLFEELLGKNQSQIKLKISKAVNQLFYGNDST
jgi:hypothetical protein